MRSALRLLAPLLLLALAPAVRAATPELIRNAALTLLRAEAARLPGEARIEVHKQRDQFQHLARCDTVEGFLPQGQAAWGRLIVGVRCTSAGTHLPVMLNAEVRLRGRYVTLARSVPGGAVLGAADLVMAEGELTRYPRDLVLNPDSGIGRTTRQAIARSQPLRTAHLISGAWVRAGQEVEVVARGSGFAVRNSGRALGTAGEGEVVRVKLASGRVITGVVTPQGAVEAGGP